MSHQQAAWQATPGGAQSWFDRDALSQACIGRDAAEQFLQPLASRGADIAHAEALSAEAAALVLGVQAVFTRTQFTTGTLPNSPLGRKAAHSFNAMRAGDILLISTPFAVPSETITRTTHGSPWNYDAQVPLILWGGPFKPGTYATPCQPIDLEPTLAALLGLTQSSEAQGKPLTESIR